MAGVLVDNNNVMILDYIMVRRYGVMAKSPLIEL